jgi:general secretion pathway protein C
LALDPLLKKYFPVLVLALIALGAYFQASGATQLVGAAFVPAAPSGSAPRPFSHPPSAAAQSEHRSGEAIIERNPFDSVTGPLTGKSIEIPVVPKPNELETGDPLTAAACDGVNAFIITESTDPLWSVAALQGSGEPRPRMRRVGDEVAGKHVEFIGFNPAENSPAVWLSMGGSLCQVLLFREQAPVASGPAAPSAPETTAAITPPPSSGRGTPVPPEIASKIQKISDTEFQVDRAVVDNILEHQAELMKSARIVPEQKDGKVLGIRLFGIRPDTLLGTLGLQNGDRLEAINGFNMGSPEKALEAYARLRTASNLNVKVSRKGAPVSIDYRIK